MGIFGGNIILPHVSTAVIILVNEAKVGLIRR